MKKIGLIATLVLGLLTVLLFQLGCQKSSSTDPTPENLQTYYEKASERMDSV